MQRLWCCQRRWPWALTTHQMVPLPVFGYSSDMSSPFLFARRAASTRRATRTRCHTRTSSRRITRTRTRMQDSDLPRRRPRSETPLVPHHFEDLVLTSQNNPHTPMYIRTVTLSNSMKISKELHCASATITREGQPEKST